MSKTIYSKGHKALVTRIAKARKEPLIRRSLILGYQISEVIKEKGCSMEEVLISEEKVIFNIPEYKMHA